MQLPHLDRHLCQYGKMTLRILLNYEGGLPDFLSDLCMPM
jgi:hypothetical protein